MENVISDKNNMMAHGSVPKTFAKLAVPAIIAQVVNLLYNIVDRIYIGHIPEVGGSALTGLGLFVPILMLISAFALLFGAGGAPLASIALGQQDKKKAENIMGNCFVLLLITSVILTAGFYFAAPAMLTFFGASDVTLPFALEYARIYILGSVFVLIVMGMNPFITAQGFAKISMLTTLIGAVVNIALDPIFIFGFGLGVRGAALATVISQAIGALWILLFLRGKKTNLRLRIENFKLSPKIFLPCMALGISTFVMLSTESLLSMSFTSSLFRYGGDIAVGAMTIITSVCQLATMPLQGLCQGGQPLISYNYGAGNTDRVKKTFYLQFGICLAYATLFCVISVLLPNVLTGIFTSDKALVEHAAWALRIYMSGIFAFGAQIACQQSFMALGQAKVSLFLACLRKIILLIPLIFILPLLIENKEFAVFLAEPVSDIIAATVTTVVFFASFNKILNKSKKKGEEKL